MAQSNRKNAPFLSDSDDKLKAKEISLWLNEVLSKDQSISQVQLNQRSFNLLLALMEANKRAEANAVAYREFLDSMSAEYTKDSLRLSAILTRLGASADGLSSAGRSHLNELANVGASLDLAADVSDTTYMLALSRRIARLEELRTQKQALEKACRQVTERHQDSIQLAGKVSTACEALPEVGEQEESEAYAEEKSREALFLRAKCKKYSTEISSLDKKLRSRGDGSLTECTHEHLKAQAAKLEDLSARLRPIREKLAAYKGLPPDVSLAKVEIAKAKAELTKLEGDLAQRIEFMHT